VAGLDRAVALAVGAVLVVVLAFVDEVVGRVLAAEQLGGVVGVVRYGAEEAGHRVAAGRSVFAVGALGRVVEVGPSHTGVAPERRGVEPLLLLEGAQALVVVVEEVPVE